MTVKEDRSHNNHTKNPRRWPRGSMTYTSSSKVRPWPQYAAFTLLSVAEMMYVNDVPRLLGAGDYANLGHSRGGSALLMASSLDEYKLKGRIYSVDLFNETKHSWRRAEERLEKFHTTAERIEICKGSTIEWATKLEDKRFNFVFIDADHCYDAVKRDFYDWSFLVKPGGWMAFHDTNQEWSHQAIEETVAQTWDEQAEFHVDRIRTFQKPS